MGKKNRISVNRIFRNFFNSQTSGGNILIFSTFLSLIIANSFIGDSYIKIWHFSIKNTNLNHIINDGLMSIFFLLIGLELKRELIIGELCNYKKAILPVFAAIGGMIIPALIYILCNISSLDSINGFGIPMATDIAFAMAILTMLGNKVPISLKIFLTALAVIDDLGAILVIALFYPNVESPFNLMYFIYSLILVGLLFVINFNKIKNIIYYLSFGLLLWYCIFKSGLHPTISGVILAFCIPFEGGHKKSLSYKLQNFLHLPVAYFILPLFVLSNTAIKVSGITLDNINLNLCLGIFFGLFIGKPLGIFLFSLVLVKLNFCVLPNGLDYKRILGLGLLGGIGFTMSIFVSMLAFNNLIYVEQAKMLIMISSFFSAFTGFIYLNYILSKK